MTTLSGTSLGAALANTVLFRAYQEAFQRATGLPLGLHEPGQTANERTEVTSPLCALLRCNRHTCDTCADHRVSVEREAMREPQTVQCFAGLCETLVPVLVGGKTVAFLRTGGVLLEEPNRIHFESVSWELQRLGVDGDLQPFEEAYFSTHVLNAEQYEAMVRLLTIFAEDLAVCGNRLILQQSTPDYSPIYRAKQIIADEFRGEIPLPVVAKRVGVSATYFSMLFKKTTGLSFVDYVSRLRVEEAKGLLENSKYRVGEVAFKVGFKSLSQFNRVFRRICGRSPKACRPALSLRNVSPVEASGKRRAAINP